MRGRVLELTVEVDGNPVYDPGLIGYGTPGQLVRSVPRSRDDKGA